MKCSNCGNELNENELFCGSCGQKVDAEFAGGEEQLSKDRNYAKGTEGKADFASWYYLRISGIIISLVSIWLPWLSQNYVDFSSGRFGTISGSLWELYRTEFSMESFLYLGIIGNILALVLTIMKKNILSIIFWLVGGSPSFLILSMASSAGNVRLKIGAYLTIMGTIWVICSIIMKRKTSKKEK